MRLSLVLAAALLAGGCPFEAYDTVTAGHLATLPAAAEATRQRMHTRFGAARRMQEAIARSDLERARVEARMLASLDEPDLLPAWRPHLDGIRDIAHRIETTGDPITAAQLAADLGGRCAGCHTAAGAHIAFADEPRPQPGARLLPQMGGHQWAAARMWEGLIGPSEARWLEGARALTTVPLDTVAQSVTPTSDLDVDDVARVRLYAQRALSSAPQVPRAELFGKLLATCAHCHAVLRDR